MLSTEFKRIFSWTYLWKSILGIILILSIGTISYIYQNNINHKYWYDVFQNVIIGGFFIELIYIPAAYYITQNLYSDIKNKSFYLFVSRSSKNSYIKSKILVGIIFSFLVAEIALNIWTGIGISSMQIIDTEYYSGGADAFEDLLKRNTLLYFELRILLISFSVSLYTAIGMIITTIISNKYVSAVSAFVASIILQKIMLITRIPVWVDISSIVGGYIRISNSILYSMVYLLVFFIFCIAILGLLFSELMRRRLFDEKK